MILKSAFLLGLVAVVLSNGHDGLIRTYFESSPKSADAGQTINFYLESKYHPGYPASLEDDEVRINFVGLSGFTYNKVNAHDYVNCNLQRDVQGFDKYFDVKLEGFTSGKVLKCNFTMTLSGTLPPASTFKQNLVLNWEEREATADANKISMNTEFENTIRIPDIKMVLKLGNGLETFYTCGPPALDINIVLDFPAADLSEFEVELEWPLGSSDPMTQIIEIPTSNFGQVTEASGVTAGALTGQMNTASMTTGVYTLVNIKAKGQGEGSLQDIIVEAKLNVLDEFNPMPLRSLVDIVATLKHDTRSDEATVPVQYTARLEFLIDGTEMYQRWECDQDVNGGYTAYCYLWIENGGLATKDAIDVEITFSDWNTEVTIDAENIAISEPYSLLAADLPTIIPTSYTGNTDTGLRLNDTLKTQKKIKVKIPLKIGRAVVGPIKAGKVTVSYKNDYATFCSKDMETIDLNFMMMIPTFEMEGTEDFEDYFPVNIPIGQSQVVVFPLRIPQGFVDMTIQLKTDAEEAAQTTDMRSRVNSTESAARRKRATGDTPSEFATALNMTSVTVAADQANTLGYNPEDASYGFTFVAFENPIDTFNTSRDIVNITVNFTMNDLEWMEAGDKIKVMFLFVVNDYTYNRTFNMIVGEPDIGYEFQTVTKAGRIYWNVTAFQRPGARSNAYNVTYAVMFSDEIPVVSDSEWPSLGFTEKVFDQSTVSQYWWYRTEQSNDSNFNFAFVTYLDDSSNIKVQTTYKSLPEGSFGTPRHYNSTGDYQVELHRTYAGRNLRVIIAAFACFFIGVLFAMLIMLVCCKRTTVLPLPTKFELYSRRPAVKIDPWIKDRGDLLLTAELADDLCEALTEPEYKAALSALDRLDMAHTVTCEEEMSKQQRALVLESVGWIVTVSDLLDAAKRTIYQQLFQQLQKEHTTEEVELTKEEGEKAVELERELQKTANSSQVRLMDQQDAEIDSLVTVLQAVPFQERVDFIELMKQQHEVQRTDLESLLKMQLEEAREKLRKDYMVRKRVCLNILIREFFSDLAESSNLNNDLRDDLVSRSKHYIEVIDEAFHEETCRQKFVLEERLLKREAILRMKEERVKYHDNLMMTVSSSMKQTINRLIRESLIKRSQGEELLAQINHQSNENKNAMMTVMANYEGNVREAVRSKAQEKAKKLLNGHLEAYEMFQKKYNEKIKKREISPAEFLERKIKFHVGRRIEEEQLMDEMDEMAKQEMAMIWDHYTNESVTRFRENQDRIFDQLIKKAIIGSSQTEVQRQRNFRDQTKLEGEKNNAISQIEQALKQRIVDSDERIKCQVEAERQEQTALKDQEAKMVERLLESQLVMNEETRANVMKEHRRNLLELEEGLTVTKLRYKRKKQEKLAAKTARKLEALEQKQMEEREMFRQGEGRTDDTMQIMLHRHQDERMELLATVENLNIEEAEIIHDEIMTEKSMMLTDQKRRLASMLASLQVEKSREVATLRGQLNALTKVELNLIDDLSARGVLDETKTKGLIDTHLAGVDQNITELNESKNHQKGILVKRLNKKLKSLEEELVARHQAQAEDITQSAEKSPAYMYKKMLLLQKQKNERKQLRDNLRIEIDQAVEELERKFELNRLRAIKVRELKFISEIIQHADFDKEELADVFKAMFVTRSKEELEEVLEHAKHLTPAEKEKRGSTLLFNRAKKELTRRQSSQRFQLTSKRQGLLKPKIRPRLSKANSGKFFPRSVRTVAQEAMVMRLESNPDITRIDSSGNLPRSRMNSQASLNRLSGDQRLGNAEGDSLTRVNSNALSLQSSL